MDLHACLSDRRRYERQIDRLHNRYLFTRQLYELQQDDVSLASLILNRSKVAKLIAKLVRRGQYVIEWPRLEIGAETLGVPTAHASGVADSGRSFVWASASGSHRGEAILPLLPQALELPEADPEVYLALAVIDSIRIGGARERREAGAWLRAWLENPTTSHL